MTAAIRICDDNLDAQVSKQVDRASIRIMRRFQVNELPSGLQLDFCTKIDIRRVCILYESDDHAKNQTAHMRLHTDGYANIREESDGTYVLEMMKGSGRVRNRVDISITRDTFELLLKEYGDTLTLNMTRHVIPIPCDGGRVYLIAYKGKVDGFKVAEVVFESEEKADRFNRLPWFGAEVTEDMDLLNAMETFSALLRGKKVA